MSSNVFNHPFLNGLLGSAKMSALFEADTDIDRMLEFQSALAKAQGELGIIPEEAALKIQEVLERLFTGHRKTQHHYRNRWRSRAGAGSANSRSCWRTGKSICPLWCHQSGCHRHQFDHALDGRVGNIGRRSGPSCKIDQRFSVIALATTRLPHAPVCKMP